jgi:hypothetical protein
MADSETTSEGDSCSLAGSFFDLWLREKCENPKAIMIQSIRDNRIAECFKTRLNPPSGGLRISRFSLVT